VTSELATNALLHAHTAFVLTLEGWDEVVVLTIRDDSLSLPTRRAAQATDPTGRGLEIVEIVSSDWGTNSDAAGSKAVWASFIIKGPHEF
jgi:two-component sensor histidine kinase